MGKIFIHDNAITKKEFAIHINDDWEASDSENIAQLDVNHHNKCEWYFCLDTIESQRPSWARYHWALWISKPRRCHKYQLSSKPHLIWKDNLGARSSIVHQELLPPDGEILSSRDVPKQSVKLVGFSGSSKPFS